MPGKPAFAGIKSPSITDIHVGAQIKQRRTVLGLSQGELADNLGVSFQQVQKYEKGTNRIGAGRLQQIADALDLDVQALFPKTNGHRRERDAAGEKTQAAINEVLSTNMGVTLITNFARIRRLGTRRAIVDLVAQIAE